MNEFIATLDTPLEVIAATIIALLLIWQAFLIIVGIGLAFSGRVPTIGAGPGLLAAAGSVTWYLVAR